MTPHLAVAQDRRRRFQRVRAAARRSGTAWAESAHDASAGYPRHDVPR